MAVGIVMTGCVFVTRQVWVVEHPEADVTLMVEAMPAPARTSLCRKGPPEVSVSNFEVVTTVADATERVPVMVPVMPGQGSWVAVTG